MDEQERSTSGVEEETVWTEAASLCILTCGWIEVRVVERDSAREERQSRRWSRGRRRRRKVECVEVVLAAAQGRVGCERRASQS